jgi:hypothetical protein
MEVGNTVFITQVRFGFKAVENVATGHKEL